MAKRRKTAEETRQDHEQEQATATLARIQQLADELAADPRCSYDHSHFASLVLHMLIGTLLAKADPWGKRREQVDVDLFRGLKKAGE